MKKGPVCSLQVPDRFEIDVQGLRLLKWQFLELQESVRISWILFSSAKNFWKLGILNKYFQEKNIGLEATRIAFAVTCCDYLLRKLNDEHDFQIGW